MSKEKNNNATLAGTVWNDANHDGIQNDGNIGIADVKVVLLNDDGKATGKFALTDSNGNYSFSGLKPGEYSVKFDPSTLPTGATFTQKDAGGNDTIDSDADAITGKTNLVELHTHETNNSLDAGITLALSSFNIGAPKGVWYDIDRDGIKGVDEPGIAGVTVTLVNLGADITSPTDDVIVGSTVTNTFGDYNFPNLDSSLQYKLVFSGIPADQEFTLQHARQGFIKGLDPIDSDANITTGETDLAISSFTSAGLRDKLATSSFSGAGNRVWNDVNQNGLQDSGETGVAGVTVQLVQAGSDAIFGTTDDVIAKTTTTDADGAYGFTDIVNDFYQVHFSNIDQGSQFTVKDFTFPFSNQDRTDSDVNPTTGYTDTLDLTRGEIIQYTAAGVKPAPVAALTVADTPPVDIVGTPTSTLSDLLVF